MLTRFNSIALTMALAGALTLGGSAIAARRVCDDGSYPPCAKPPPAEAASNNLSFPVIWPEGVYKPDFVPSPGVAWTFAEVLEDEVGHYTQASGGEKVYCVGETDITPPEKIPPEVLCYYGRFNAGIDEDTDEPVLTGDPKVWWLQQRAQNRWQVYNTVDPDTATPVVVTGVDTGDLLESSIVIKAKVIRTEFTLFKNVDDDADFAGALTPEAGGTCALGTPATNCFAAHAMSGAVPGTDRSIAETHGTDYPDPAVDTSDRLAPEFLLKDPRDVKKAINYFDPTIPVPAAMAADPGTESENPDPRIVPIDPPLGMDATIYSNCARMIIQKTTGDVAGLYWDSDEGSWMPRSIANSPVVDISTYGGDYSAEINAGGNLIYGYNWNTKSLAEGAGAYRITFLLESDLLDGGRCTSALNTVFDETSRSINVGERRPATILSADGFAGLGATHGEGGAVYIDVEIGTTGGGGGGGGGKGRQ